MTAEKVMRPRKKAGTRAALSATTNTNPVQSQEERDTRHPSNRRINVAPTQGRFQNVADQTATSQLLLRKGIRPHTWRYPSENVTRLLRGIPAQIPTEEILKDLKRQGVKALRVSRLICRRSNERLLYFYMIQAPSRGG